MNTLSATLTPSARDGGHRAASPLGGATGFAGARAGQAKQGSKELVETDNPADQLARHDEQAALGNGACRPPRRKPANNPRSAVNLSAYYQKLNTWRRPS